MKDLIKRAREAAGTLRESDEPFIAELVRELADALEGAERDAERWRALKRLNGRVQWYWDEPARAVRHSGEVWSEDFGGLDATMDAASAAHQAAVAREGGHD